METSSPPYPRDVGESITTLDFPESDYSTKYQEWFYEKYSDRISGRVLDIGAETNQLDRYRREGADIDEYISLDRRKNETLSIQGDATALPFCSETFDTVILREVVEHVPVSDVYGVFSEIHRVLSSDGTLLLSTPFRFPVHGLDYTDTLRFTAVGLQGVLTEAGFDEVRVYKGGGFAESMLSPIQTAWSTALEKAGWKSLSGLFALVHYPVVVASAILSALLEYSLGENRFKRTFYLHNMAVASKRSGSVRSEERKYEY